MTQRTIKLRAWDKQEGKMYLVNKLDNPHYDSGAVMLHKNWGIEVNDKWQSLGSVALMQFTGLTDKNGKEIWEGDIVKGDYPLTTGR